MRRIILADNLKALATLPDGCVALIYIDPPFNTGRTQRRDRLRTVRSDTGDRVGFGGKRYTTTRLGALAYDDSFDDYLAFLEPRLREARRVLSPTGTIYVHLDYREAHYVKVLLDTI
ncbi:MAG: site-specific DNA-methyltransferase, partial [Dehalococcoidia bacterium]|nr:site-specific DNA-methyltransferase [Dehalococcoidia bacterium]